MNREERKDLNEFLGEVKELMGWVVNDPDSYVPDYLRTPLSSAWVTTKERFEPLAQEIESGRLDSDLDRHGLSGPELHAKLIAFRAYYGSWASLRDRRQSQGPGPTRWLRAIWRFFRRGEAAAPDEPPTAS